ncbi:mannan endo-1,4-beta-mannosidase 4-like [Magnolia sinica]|uniref:mannan endo-1,4-beta-mannosidase 4-like n=1 Tax=Magnolia sinica TaxID=86752 RepID=UPI00265A1CCB|nr:mannan endo-1,4-beta-mannosidase 4-like [Magnolia sinica]
MRVRWAFGIILFVVFMVIQHEVKKPVSVDGGFGKTIGTHFLMNGRHFYMNGFNAYWLMYMASDPSSRGNVTSAFQQSSGYGMTMARTWAFRDGGYKPLQIKPGVYDEIMFQGLDFMISEAKKYGIYLILCLVNNYPDLGGRKQYVKWATEQGQSLTSDDDFYTNNVVKGFYKNNVKAVLTRMNTFTGVAYKDDPTIFAWELINEPRCESDLSGNTLQDWIAEMAAFVKSIDSNHLLEVGLEGFYGESQKQSNPGGYQFGTDFISNNQIPEIDFATVHAYPDQWLADSSEEDRLNFLHTWSEAHIQDSIMVLKRPLLLTEFGKSSKASGYTINKRDAVFETHYDIIYSSANSGGPYAGGLFWQLLDPGMDYMRDGFEVIIPDSPSTANIIAQQSKKISALNR